MKNGITISFGPWPFFFIILVIMKLGNVIQWPWASINPFELSVFSPLIWGAISGIVYFPIKWFVEK